MAALVTANIGQWNRVFGVNFAGPTTVATASETDLSTPNTSYTFDTKGVGLVCMQVVFANYTSVTVKLQRSVDGGTTWADITNGSISTSGTIASVDPQAPLCRISIAGTLSGSTDTMTVHLYMERMVS
jgi:hypothetical protein